MQNADTARVSADAVSQARALTKQLSESESSRAQLAGEIDKMKREHDVSSMRILVFPFVRRELVKRRVDRGAHLHTIWHFFYIILEIYKV